MSESMIDRIDQWMFLKAPGPVLAVIDVWKRSRRRVNEKLTTLCLLVIRRLNRSCDRALSYYLHELGSLYATRPELIVTLPDTFDGDISNMGLDFPLSGWLPVEQKALFVDVSVVDKNDAIARIEKYRAR